MEEILALYRQAYNSKRPLVCFDEASYQLLGHTRDPIRVQQGSPAKQDSEYKRNGNLNTHRYLVLIEIFGKTKADHIMKRLCFHYTPPHGSWLNMAEIEIDIMRHQCLRRRIADEWTLRAELMSWEMRSNDACRKIHWSFTVDDARRVFKEHYPSKS